MATRPATKAVGTGGAVAGRANRARPATSAGVEDLNPKIYWRYTWPFHTRTDETPGPDRPYWMPVSIDTATT